jgi:hypothetical protein
LVLDEYFYKEKFMKKWKLLKLFGAAGAITCGLVLFQNCGEGFETTSLPSAGQQIVPAPPPGVNLYTATITWDDPNPASDVTGYNIYYGKTMSDMTTVIGAAKSAVTTSITSQVPNLERGVQYYFAVTVTGPSGESDKSAIVQFTPPL